MSNKPPGRPQWNAAVERAPFVLYEPGEFQARWVGGFSFSGAELEIDAIVDGFKVSVSTSAPDRRFREGWAQRAAMSELVWHNMMAGTDPLDLPHVITVESDDRPVMIGAEERTVSGMRIAGDSRWVGTLDIDDVQVKIVTSSEVRLSLRPCTDPLSVPERPPRAEDLE